MFIACQDLECWGNQSPKGGGALGTRGRGIHWGPGGGGSSGILLYLLVLILTAQIDTLHTKQSWIDGYYNTYIYIYLSIPTHIDTQICV